METKICDLCQQEKPKKTFNKHYVKCKKRFDRYPINSFINDYNNGASLPEISDKYKLSVGAIYRIFKSIGFTTRNISQSCNDHKKNKTKKTLLERYGVEHNFQKGVLRDVWEDRLFNDEGIVNVFQRDEVKNKIKETLKKKYNVEHPMSINGIKERIKENCIKKYGVEHPMLLSWVRAKQRSNISHNKLTKIHKQVNDHLTQNGFNTDLEFELLDGNRSYFYDILIIGSNKIIEVNGDYWHFNPLFYKATDIVKIPGNSQYLVGDKWLYDEYKNNLAIKNGYEVLVIWECDLKTDKKNTLNKIIEYGKS